MLIFLVICSKLIIIDQFCSARFLDFNKIKIMYINNAIAVVEFFFFNIIMINFRKLI
jgi:low affinity Fe/Cu permease